MRIENAFVRVSVTLAALALVGGDEFSRPPKLLVVHGAALVAKGSASIVLANAFVLHAVRVHLAFSGVAVARTLTTEGDVSKAVKIAAQNRRVWVRKSVHQKLVVGQNIQFTKA